MKFRLLDNHYENTVITKIPLSKYLVSHLLKRKSGYNMAD